MTEEPTHERLLAGVDALRTLPGVHRQLVTSSRVSALLARAVEAACPHCGFARGVILAIGPGELIAAESEAIGDEASDKLRRQALANPIPLTAGTGESEWIRRLESGGSHPPPADGPLKGTLGLQQYVVAAIAPESRPLALLVLDRGLPPVDAVDQAIVDGFAAMLALALEHVVLRARAGEAGRELRHLTVSAEALMRELVEAPVTLPADMRHRSAFPSLDTIDSGLLGSAPPGDLFNERELAIVSLLAEGRSNREIAERLIVSPETVKTHVARILRKLGASNRAEAVSRYLRLAQAPRE
jgi:DNA-binding CsgD family transcriptional regulator